MTGLPSDRCGYTWPPSHSVDDIPNRQGCCWRETTIASDRCLLHADADEVEKDSEKVAELLGSAADPPLLDGVDLSGLDVGHHITSTRDQPSPAVDVEDLSDEEVERLLEDHPNLLPGISDPDLLREMIKERSQSSVNHPLSGASLRGSDLSGTNLWRTSLEGSDLRDADLSGGKFNGVNFAGASLDGADLSGAAVKNADLTNSKLVAADLSGAEVSSSDLSGADLKYADLSDATLKSLDLANADFRDADFSDTYFSSVSVNGANLGFADLSDATF